MSKIPTSFFSRGTKLLGVASKIAFEELTSRISVWEDEAEKLSSKVTLARDVVKTLSELKGASMKVGQLLSLDLGDYLPPEVVKILEQLHQKSTFLPYPVVEALLKKEFGGRFEDLQDISELPIAAASIGQVHTAYLGQKKVVLKVQYPGVADSIPSDIKILESLLKKVMFLKRKGDVDVSSFMEEIKEVLSKEADYLNEQHMQLKYKTKFKGDDFIIPEVYAQYSTKTVLTQEYVEGVSFTQWLDLNPETKVKEKMAHLFMKLYLDEIFHHKLVQTDPNPGNFLITSDEKMVLIDFGAVKEYDHSFVAGYKKVLMYSYMNDRENLLKVSYELQFIDSRESQEVKDIYVKMMDHLVNPFRQEESFDFNDKVFFNTSRDLSWEMSLKCKYSPPPRNLLFLHRKLAGVFTFIKKLQVKIRLKDYWKYVEDA